MNVTSALIAGMGLGLIYFGGLWVTVRTVGTNGTPASIPFSFAARQAALAVGLCALWQRGGSPGGLIPGLFGVWLARGGLIWWLSRGRVL
jgi:F1F0 ATPase subunit 2